MVLKKLKPYLLRYRREYFWGILALLLTIGFGVAVPWFLKYPIDILKEQGATRSFYLHILLFLGMAGITAVFRFFMRRILIGISRKIEYDLRNDFFAHLQKLSRSFYNRHRTGDIMARATNDINAVRNLLGPGIMYSLYTFFYTLFALVMMLKLDVKLTALALIPFPIVAIGVSRMFKRLYRFSSRVQGIFSDLTARAEENFSGIRVIKAYRQEDHEIDKFLRLNRNYMTNNLKLAMLRGGLFAGITLFAGLGLAVVLYFGGLDVIRGRLTLGEFVSFNTYLTTLIWPMIAIGWVINLFQMGSASYDRLERILSQVPEIRDTEATDFSITRLSGDVELRNVSFRYSEDSEDVLHNISFRIDEGMLVAVVGATGSGKSTLLQLLARLYDPTEGEIFLGGHEIRTIPLNVLRKSVRVVPQEDFLFSETIQENIAFGGEREFDQEEVRRIAEAMQLASEVEAFPQGYDTLLGERGINLSGGQKQRLAIARAVLSSPRILLMDDALSAVDPVTERAILQALREQFAGTTRIVVSHRITSLTDADLILVLDRGRLVELGRHEDLVALDGVYADLYRKQLIEEELERIE